MRVAAILGLGSSTSASATVRTNLGCALADWVARELNRRGCHSDFGRRRHGAPSSAATGQTATPGAGRPPRQRQRFCARLEAWPCGRCADAWRQFASASIPARRREECAPDRSGSDLDTVFDRRICEPDNPSRGRYFCCVGGVGLDVEVARRANRLPRAAAPARRLPAQPSARAVRFPTGGGKGPGLARRSVERAGTLATTGLRWWSPSPTLPLTVEAS